VCHATIAPAAHMFISSKRKTAEDLSQCFHLMLVFHDETVRLTFIVWKFEPHQPGKPGPRAQFTLSYSEAFRLFLKTWVH
jgi:hypothetical protein